MKSKAFDSFLKRAVNFEIVEQTKDLVLIRDLGPWSQYLSVTNGAEQVVDTLAPMLKGRRLEYLDSEGERAELLIQEGKFVGFGLARMEGKP